jgi:cell division protein FtsW
MEKKGHIDWILMLSVIALMVFSVAFVYSASSTIAEIKFGSAEKLFMRHLFMVVISICVMLFTSQVDYKWFSKHSTKFLLFAIFMLILVLFMGTSSHGASRWLILGPVSFQPTEIAKFTLIFHFAKLLANKQNRMESFQIGFLPFLLWISIISVLIALQPNFSNMILIFGISMFMMFIGNVRASYLFGLSGVGAVVAIIYALSAQYRLNRLYAFFGVGEPNSAIENVSYQLNQSLISIGNGGILGVGAGQSRQSHMFLPESYGDFIFAIIGEEFGYVGLMTIIILFALIFYRGIIIAKNTNDKFGYYLTVGIIITFGTYAFINAGVNTGLLPTTGVPMPFISYGGSALIIYAGAMGVLLNISSKAGVYHIETDKLDKDKTEE